MLCEPKNSVHITVMLTWPYWSLRRAGSHNLLVDISLIAMDFSELGTIVILSSPWRLTRRDSDMEWRKTLEAK